MAVKSAAALSVGDQIIHDGTARLVKPLVVRSIANDEVRVGKPKNDESGKALTDMLSLNGSHLIVNDSITFHKTWEVTVK